MSILAGVELCCAVPVALGVTLTILAAWQRWQRAKDKRDEWMRW